MKNNLNEQPQKVQLIIEHNLHHDISYTTEDESDKSSSSSLQTPLLSDRSVSAHSEFNSIHAYFSDDSEDLILRRRSSAARVFREGNSANTPMLPMNFAEELENKRLFQKQYKHDIHQKVRWYKLLFQVAKILKWWMVLMICVMFLPLSMYSIIDPLIVILASFVILLLCFIYQIYNEHKFVLLDIEIQYEHDQSRIIAPRVTNPNEFNLVAVIKTLKYYVREKLSVFIVGIMLIAMYSVLFPFITSGLCVGAYDEAEGLVWKNSVVSTYFSRYLDEDLCAYGVCHAYLTLPTEPSSSMIINFHIAGQSWFDVDRWNAHIEYWPKGSVDSSNKIRANQVYYDPPEEKANRLVFSNKIEYLLPDTIYEFQVRFFNDRKENNDTSAIKRFRTFPDNPWHNSNFTVVFGGDIGNLEESSYMHKTVSSLNPYAAFVGGDLVFDSGFPECYCMWDRFFRNWENNMI